MESFYNRLKSLKDTTLEYAVLNFDILFEIAPIPMFPCNLFDEILEKSEDMCWPINTLCLWRCMVIKDKLRWSDSSLLKFVGCLLVGNLRAKAHVLKTIKVTVHQDKPAELKFLKDISKEAGVLENLELSLLKSNASSDGINATDSPLKLKRFCLTSEEPCYYIPFTLDPSELTVLELCSEKFTKYLVGTLAGLEQLVQLSLQFVTLQGVSLEELVEAVARLKGLRILIMDAADYVNESMLNKLLNISSLDVLEVTKITLTQPNQLLLPRRKLQTLIYQYLLSATESPLTGLAHRIGNHESLEGLITILSDTKSRHTYRKAANALFRHIRNVQDLKMLTEAEKDGEFNFRSAEVIHSTPKSTSYDLKLRLACYGMNVCKKRNYEFFKCWIDGFVTHNKDTHLAKEITRLAKL